MPVPEKKRITAEKAFSMSDPSPPLLPEQQAFDQHLRTLAASARCARARELVMREELDAFIGAPGEHAVGSSKGYRNGTYTRVSSDSDGPTGRSEACEDDREGQFTKQVFDRYSRYERATRKSFQLAVSAAIPQ